MEKLEEFHEAEKVLEEFQGKFSEKLQENKGRKDLSMDDVYFMTLKEMNLVDISNDENSFLCRLLRYYRSDDEQYMGMDLEELSIYSIDEHHFEGGDLTLEGGYQSLITKLAEGIKVLLENQVESVVTSESAVDIYCANGKVFKSKYAILAVPVNVLQKKMIQFTPSLPSSLTNALSHVGLGLMNKIVMIFPRNFWEEDTSTLTFTVKEKGLQLENMLINRGF